jgi:transcriptional regulator with XRE-family HTH domain
MAKSIGNQIRIRRKILRISQHVLGSSLTPPIKQQVVSKIERGAKEPTATQLFHISHLLDVPMSYFFEGLLPPEVKSSFHKNRE